MRASFMKEESCSGSGGIGFVGLLQILFIALKLMGYIQWSWVWVLSPIWLSIIGAIVIVLIFTLMFRGRNL